MEPVIYANGLVHCIICADKSLEREHIELWVNLNNPTGIDSPWKVVDEQFRTGEPNPVECNTDKERRHWLPTC